MHSRHTLHTLGTLWAHSEHTLGRPGHTMGTLWAHSGHTHGLIMIGLNYCALKALRITYFRRQPKILLDCLV